jgi:hypothetical protein
LLHHFLGDGHDLYPAVGDFEVFRPVTCQYRQDVAVPVDVVAVSAQVAVFLSDVNRAIIAILTDDESVPGTFEFRKRLAN